jgi:hypothetical protein
LSSLIGCDQIGTAKESKIKLTDWQTEGQPIIKKNRQLHNRGGGGRTVLMNNNITISKCHHWRICLLLLLFSRPIIVSIFVRF